MLATLVLTLTLHVLTLIPNNVLQTRTGSAAHPKHLPQSPNKNKNKLYEFISLGLDISHTNTEITQCGGQYRQYLR